MANEKNKNSNSNLGIEDISVLLETLEKHEVTEFKLERLDEKLWLKRGPQVQPSYATPYPPQYQGYPTGYAAPAAPQGQPASTPSGSAEIAPALSVVSPIASKNIKEIRSPMVGTFYRRPAVDAESYVNEGDQIKKGDVLCIIEAMKLMNEIESEFAGKVSEICLEDGQMVEYGEVLFKVEVS